MLTGGAPFDFKRDFRGGKIRRVKNKNLHLHGGGHRRVRERHKPSSNNFYLGDRIIYTYPI